MVLHAISLLIFTGCWDKTELNDRAFVNAVAIDRAEGEADKRFDVGVAVSELDAYEGNSAGGEDEGGNKSVKSSTGRTVSSAIRKSEESSSQELFFGHAKAVFFGENLLKDKTLFMEALDALERDAELSRKMLVLAAAGESVRTIGAKPKGEPSIGVFADNFYKVNESGATFRMTLEDLFISLKNMKSAVIPKISEKNGELKIGGAAVIKEFELCGYLNEKETRGYLWQKGGLSGAEVIIEKDGVHIPFTVEAHKKKVRFTDGGETPEMQIDVRVTGSVDEFIFGKTLRGETDLAEIERLVCLEIKNEIESLFRKLKSEMRVDAAGTIAALRKKSYVIWEKYVKNGDGQKVFENMPINVNVDAKIKSTGLIN